MTDVFIKERRGRFETHGHGKEDHLKMKLETGVRLLEVRKLLELPEAGRSKEGLSPGAFRGSVALPTP